jgi:flagellar motor switch protein FliN/FliY
MEELPPLAEGELSDSESETPEPEDSAASDAEETPEEPEANQEAEDTSEPEETVEDSAEVNEPPEEDAVEETAEPEAELTLDEELPETEPETTPEPETEVPEETIVAAPVEENATDLSENEMTNETVAEATAAAGTASDMLLHFQHEVRVEVARTRLTGKEITQITSGSIIELDKAAGEPVELVLDDRTIAQGEVVMINKDKLGIRIIGIIQN